jgi:hypothetical protein
MITEYLLSFEKTVTFRSLTIYDYHAAFGTTQKINPIDGLSAFERNVIYVSISVKNL